MHLEYGTPLHLACKSADGASLKKLLEYGADVNATDSEGRSPLNRSLTELEDSGRRGDRRREAKSAFAILCQEAKGIKVNEEDFVVAARLRRPETALATLLEIDPEAVLSERMMCAYLARYLPEEKTFEQLMEWDKRVIITKEMLKAVAVPAEMAFLLKHPLDMEVSTDVLMAQKDIGCIELLLDASPDVRSTEELVFKILESRLRGDGDKELVLKKVWERNSDLRVTEDMLRAAKDAPYLKFLFEHAQQDVSVIDMMDDLLQKTLGKHDRNAHQMRELLLRHSPSHKVTPAMKLKIISDYPEIESLAILLDHEPDTVITTKMLAPIFDHVPSFGKNSKVKLLEFLKGRQKKLIFTKSMRDMIDTAFQDQSQAAMKGAYYKLRERDASEQEEVKLQGEEKASIDS